MKIAYFWTPAFSADVLSGLLAFPDIQVVTVVSQPDKPVGRKKTVSPTPVKRIALEHDIPVLQPEKLRHNTEFSKILSSLDLDFIVVVAYGKIIPQSILDIPQYGSINLHGSLLPLYRWASPVQSSIADGQKETWLTTMYMNARMDEWDILMQAKIPIDNHDTSEDIFTKFVQQWPEVLHATLDAIMHQDLSWTPQNSEYATYCGMIEKQDGKVSFSLESVTDIYNKFRAFTSWPGIYIDVDGKKLALETVTPFEDTLDIQDTEPGKFILLAKNRYGIVWADGNILEILQVKPE